MDPEHIEYISLNLRELCRIGKAQLDEARQIHNFAPTPQEEFTKTEERDFPAAERQARLLAEPFYFLIRNIESYWTVYETALDILDKPAIRFTVRTIMEICYLRIIRFSSLLEHDQENKVLQFWLCTDGLLADNDSSRGRVYVDRYRAALELLVSPKERTLFSDLACNGYPKDKYHRLLHELFPGISADPGAREFIEPFLVKVWGKSYSFKDLELQFRSASMILHGNPVVVRMLNQDKDTHGHILYCAKVLHYTGVTLLRFCEQNLDWRITQSALLSEIQNNLREYLHNLWSQRRDG